ncbi:MAG: alkaline phosphatase family protein [Candidatus Gribaldobacteria bacterium]|nr:alkaline phosphatase family protein [Candidatus Gribaldobacteria bacterium]
MVGKKIIFLVVDGMGDRAIKELGDQTPLEAARKPNFNLMAQQGVTGLVQPTYLGSFPTSQDAHLSLFGYDLKTWQIGRGVFEALGMDWNFKKGDVALRGNFATIDPVTKMVLDRRAGRIEKTESLIKSLEGIKIRGISFFFKQGVYQRIAVIMRGKGLSEKVSDGDSHKDKITALRIKPLVQEKSAIFTTQVLNEFLAKSQQILQNHPLNKARIKKGFLPANYILLREAGIKNPLPSFKSLWGLKACCIAGGDLYQGIGKALQMDLIKVKGATGKDNTNLKGKFEAAKKALKKYDFVFCHIKAVDNFGHDGDYLGKKRMLEKIDQFLPILMQSKALVVVTADHCTPCILKEHSKDLIPVLVFGNGNDTTENFSEKACKQGKLGVTRGIDLLPKIIKIDNTNK